MSPIVAPWTKASTSRGRAGTCCGSPDGYGTGVGHEADLESTVYMPFGRRESGITKTFRERRIEHAAEDAVRLERSIDARSARIECGFWCPLRVGLQKEREERTMMYETRKLMKETSDRGETRRGESERLMRARNASCATFYGRMRQSERV